MAPRYTGGMRLAMVSVPFSLALVGAGVWLGTRPPQARVIDHVPLDITTRHPVTEAMREAAEKLSRTPLQPIAEKDLKGAAITTAQFEKGKPTVFVFIKNTCPCSIDAQPFFNALSQAYQDKVQFWGVINGETRDAAAYVRYNRVPFPAMVDTDQSVIKDFNIAASASLALIDGDGNIRQVWPGYSQAVLRQLNFLLAGMTGGTPREIDDREAPQKLTAGCSFE